MTKLAGLITTLALAVASTASCLADKITVDPYKEPAPAAVEKPDVLDADKRLDQKITYSQGHRNVWQVVDDFSSASGVKLRSGYSLSDWLVRERKINVFVKDVPLRDLMRSIARVMRFKWESYKHEDGYTYRLIVDTKLLRKVESDRRSWQDRYRRAAVKARTDIIDRAMWLKMAPPAERERVKEEQPFCYQLELTGVNEFLAALLKDEPDVRTAIVDGTPDGSLEIAVSKLSSTTRQSIRPALDAWNRRQGLSERRSSYLDPKMDGRLTEATVVVSMDEIGPATPTDPGDPPDKYLSNHGGIVLSLGDNYYDLVQFDTPSVFFAPEARAVVAALEGKASYRQARDEEYAQYSKDHPWESAPAILPAEAKRQWLEKKVKLEFKDHYPTGIEQALAETAGLNVVSDDFRNPQMMLPAGRDMGGIYCSGQEKTVEGWLDHIRQTFTYDVDKHESIVLFNRHDWYDARDTQLPQAWIDRWRKSVEANGYIPLDDGAEIAALRWDQRQESIRNDAVLGSHRIWDAISHSDAEIARFYSSMGESQKWALAGGRGLSMGSIDYQQWQYAPRELWKRANIVGDISSMPVLTLSRRPYSRGGITHVFTLTGAGGQVIKEWQIPGGRYERRRP